MKGIGEYKTSLYMGTPLQEINNITMDTGSFLPWIKVSELCQKTGKCPGVAAEYHYKQSSTMVKGYSGFGSSYLTG
jgi:hypothetical protein